MYLRIAILCAAVLPGSFCYEDIHKYMSPEEVRHVFHTDADSVPEYEIVKIHMTQRLHKRGLPSGSHLQTTAFGENINLWLHPGDTILAGVDTPVYYAKSSESAPEGVEYRYQPGLMEAVGEIFEDPDKLASLVIGKEDTGRTRINGYIESNRLAIRSLPQRVAEEYSRRRRSVEDLEDPEYSPYHIVIKMKEPLEENNLHPLVNVTRLREKLSTSVEEVPDTLYPEILVVVENSVYTAFDTPQGHDIYGLLEYLLAFWNGVDLKYRSLESPKFRLNIAAIVLGEDANATPYIGKQMVSANAFNASVAMPLSRKFYYGVKDTFPLDSYDIAATMTRNRFGIDSGVLGQAWPASACKRNHGSETTDAVTIYYDNGLFSGVINIAHELGHTFGSYHDEDAENCDRTYGFIMAGSPRYTTNSSDFSPCSMDQIQKAIDNQKLTCLYNPPKSPGKNLPKLMPGRVKNLEVQCKDLEGGAPCQYEFPRHSVCVNLCCRNEEGECWETGVAALDGTECGGKNQFCLHQQCVSL